MKKRYILAALMAFGLLIAPYLVQAEDYGEVHCDYNSGVLAFICTDNNLWYTEYDEPTAEMIAYYESINKVIPEPDFNPVTFVTGGNSETFSGN